MSFDFKFLLTKLIANNMSYQIVMPNKNSKVSISYIATLSASFIVLGSSLFYASCNKASLIFGA